MTDLKSVDQKVVRVRVPFSVLIINLKIPMHLRIFFKVNNYFYNNTVRENSIIISSISSVGRAYNFNDRIMGSSPIRETIINFKI